MPSAAELPLYEHAAQRDGVFTIEDARRFGLSAHQIDDRGRELWRRLYRGIYLAPGAPITPRAAIRAACLTGAPHAAASHRAAAALYEVPGGNLHLAELTCPRWLRTRRLPLLVHESNRIDPRDVQLIDGIPVMRPERVLIELSSIYKSPDFIEKVLHVMRRKRLVTYTSTLDVFDRLARRGRRGISVTRIVLERWDPSEKPSESPPETGLVQILRSAGVGRVVPQLEICDANGRFIARPDAALPDSMVAVEYDSDAEHTDEISLARDNVRRNRLMAAGWIVVAARKRDVRNGGADVVAAVRAQLARRELA